MFAPIELHVGCALTDRSVAPPKTVFDNHLVSFRTYDLEYTAVIEMATFGSDFLEAQDRDRAGKSQEHHVPVASKRETQESIDR